MCNPCGATEGAQVMPMGPVDEVVQLCPLGQLPALLQRYDILLIGLQSAGSGEVAVALNVRPHLLAQPVHVIYGVANGEIDPQRAANADMRRLLQRPPAVAGDPWTLTDANHTFRPHGLITPGSKPILILAPHGYTDHALAFAAALPPNSVLASWGPFGFGNYELGPDLSLRIGPATGLMANLAGHQATDEFPKSLMNVPPLIVADNPQQHGASELLVAAAITARLANDASRLACIYGHGSWSQDVGAQVLTNLLRTALAIATVERPVTLVVIHHSLDADPNFYGRPAHLRAAVLATNSVLLTNDAADAIRGTFTTADNRLQVVHVHRLAKTCMDLLYRTADLPVTEGANTIHQLMTAGRPFLRVSNDAAAYLGRGGTAVVLRDVPLDADLRSWLRAGSDYLSSGGSAELGEAVIRRLLLNEGRERLDAFADRLRTALLQWENNILAHIGTYLRDHPLPPAALPQVPIGFAVPALPLVA